MEITPGKASGLRILAYARIKEAPPLYITIKRYAGGFEIMIQGL